MKAKAIVDELYEFRDHYFETHTLEKAGDKSSDIEQKLIETLKQLDEISLETPCKGDETEFFLQKGRAINVLPGHDQRAEDCLSKAVKKNPKSWQAWNELGICYWKNGKLKNAKDCFEGALKQELNKVSLRSLSMILRQMGQTLEEKMSNIHKSVEKAKESLDLDLTDGLSWYILGNANLSLFFLANQNSKILMKCMEAYSKALEDKIAKTHPDLHLNRATALRYEGSYQDALDSYDRALVYDPLWHEAQEKAAELFQYLEQVETMVQQKGCLKARQIRTMIKSVKTHHLGPFNPKVSTHSQAGKNLKEQIKVLNLKTGENLGTVIMGKVICQIPNAFPFTFCLLDESENCIAVSVYNQAEGKGVIIGDSVTIADPFVQEIKITYKTKNLNYFNIRISSPLNLIVNGRVMSNDHHAPPTLSVTCKSD